MLDLVESLVRLNWFINEFIVAWLLLLILLVRVEAADEEARGAGIL